MRISTNLFFNTGLNSINAQQSDLLHIYQQMGSGKRMVTPSDDPLAAAQSINLRQSEAMNERLAENRNVLKQNLNQEDQVLDSVTRLLQDVKRELIYAGNGSLADADRRSLAEVLRGVRDNMLALANTTDGNGQYMFSGYKGDVPAFDPTTGAWDNSHSGQRLIQVDETRRLASSDLGKDVFARVTPGSQAYLSSAAATNAGTGQINEPNITNISGSDMGKSFLVAFEDDGAGGLQYRVSIDGVAQPTAVPYDPAQAPLNITLGDAVSLPFSGRPVVGDTFRVDYGQTLSSADMNIFKSFEDILTALETPTLGNADVVAVAEIRNAIGTALQRFDEHYDNVLTVRASVGARLTEISAVDTAGESRKLGYAQRLQQLEDISYYEASTQLQLRTTALEAAALAFRKIQSVSTLSIRGG